MVVIDDAQAQGTTFNYGKLFGTVPKLKTDIENEQKGKVRGTFTPHSTMLM